MGLGTSCRGSAVTDHSSESQGEPTAGVATPPCECTPLQQANGHHYACVYGPLRYLPACVVKRSTTDTRSDTRLEFKAQDSWRLLRVIR